MECTAQEIKEWIAGSPDKNAKELKWQLINMGIYLNEFEIEQILEEIRLEAI